MSKFMTFCVACGKEVDRDTVDGDFVCDTCHAGKAAAGVKYDGDKARWDLLPPEAMSELVAVYTTGAIKYSDRNWEKGISWGRVFAAAMRHLWAFWRGENLDKESGHPHLAHAAWNCITLLQYTLLNVGEDTRPIN